MLFISPYSTAAKSCLDHRPAVQIHTHSFLQWAPCVYQALCEALSHDSGLQSHGWPWPGESATLYAVGTWDGCASVWASVYTFWGHWTKCFPRSSPALKVTLILPLFWSLWVQFHSACRSHELILSSPLACSGWIHMSASAGTPRAVPRAA
jgi:hypothetical protein